MPTKTLVRIGATFTLRSPTRDYEFARGSLLTVRHGDRLLVESPLYALGVDLPETVPVTTPPALLVPVTDIDPERLEVVVEVPEGVWKPERLVVQLVFADGSTAEVANVKWKRTGPSNWLAPRRKR